MKMYNALLHGSPVRWDIERKPHFGGGDGGGTSVTTPTIPDELKPLANLYTQQATQYATQPFQYYGGDRYADLNQAQNTGLQMTMDRATQGSQTLNNAEGALNQFIDGGQTNPYLDAMVGRAQQSVADNFNLMTKPQTEAAMVRSGSFGNSGLDQLLARQQDMAAENMSDIATQMYGNAYNTDQANRMQAIGMAPTFGNMAYQDAGQLLNAGNILQQDQQNNLDFAYQQFKEAADYPLRQMQATGGMLGQNMGSTTTSNQSSGGK